MKKILLLTVMITSMLCASAATYSSMRFVTNDQTHHLITLTGLEITIADGVLTATGGSQSLSLPVADLASMEFDTTSTGVADLVQDASQTPVSVYGIDGKEYGTFAGLNAASAALPSGTFIIKASDNTTTKLTLRK